MAARISQRLGGEDEISTQQSALIDLAVKSKLLLDSIDVWLLQQPSLVDKRKRALLPVVRERQSIADGFAKYMSMLGLDRQHKVKSLNDVLNEPESHAILSMSLWISHIGFPFPETLLTSQPQVSAFLV